MATIALYASKINTMPGLIQDVKKSVTDYQSELSALKKKSLQINKSVCNLDDIISSISTSTQTQEQEITSLENLSNNIEQFTSDVNRIDMDVADVINQRKDDFYNEYNYLKPDSEKNGWEKFCDACKAVGEWCKEHWKEIFVTVVIVIGAALAIAAVVFTGGMALAPMLAGLLTALGMASGTALTVATITSLVVAGIAVTSTIASSTLNMIDIWGDMGENSTFQSWKTAMNWMSAISNGFYSIGSIYNSFHGISNSALREYSNNYLTNSNFKNNILNSNNFNFNIKSDSSVFWTGMRENGGEHVAKNYTQRFGGDSLETTLAKQGFMRPDEWGASSTSFALKASGKVKLLVGSSPWKGSVWNTSERILLNINPKITGIQKIYGVIINYTPRVFQTDALFSGLSSLYKSGISFGALLGDNSDD